jgi:hypothetical protein
MEAERKEVDHDAIRRAVVRLLQHKGYAVRNIGSGSGVPKWSRVQIAKDGESFTCAIKTTTSGRISFTRASTGSYNVLSDVDRVIHGRPVPEDSGKIRISMFDSATVIQAFDANHKAKVEHGMEHIPSWISPELEAGWRFTGSGFQKKALWSEVVVLGESEVDEHTETGSSTSEVGIMDRIKQMLSEHMGVRPELIEIDVRVKL